MRSEPQTVDKQTQKVLDPAIENKNEIDNLKGKITDKLENKLHDLVEVIQINWCKPNYYEAISFKNPDKTHEEENEDLRNRSMRSILIFCGIQEDEFSDSWGDVTKTLVSW